MNDIEKCTLWQNIIKTGIYKWDQWNYEEEQNECLCNSDSGICIISLLYYRAFPNW